MKEIEKVCLHILTTLSKEQNPLNDPGTWVAFSLNLENSSLNPDDLKVAFFEWCSLLKRKKIFKDQIMTATKELSNDETEALELIDQLNIAMSPVMESSCRLCLTHIDTDAYEILSITKDLQQWLSFCLPVQVVDNDGLPQKLCLSCVQKLQSIQDFSNLCHKSHSALMSALLKEIQESQGNLQNLADKIYGQIKAEEPVIEYEEDQRNFDEIEGEERDFILETQPETQVLHTSDNSSNICDLCSKRFKTKMSLKIHSRIHFDQRPYVCEVRHRFILIQK